MDAAPLLAHAPTVWALGLGPAALLLAFVVTLRLGGEPWRGLARGLAALASRATGLAALGSLALATAATHGAALALGATTAVALVGPGALAWLWVGAALLTGARLGEALLARSDAPGRASGREPGSLPLRLRREPRRGARAVGVGLAVLALVAAFCAVGGMHARAAEISANALPMSAGATLLGLAALGALGALVGPRPWLRSAVGVVAAGALVLVAGGAVLSATRDVGSALRAVSRVLTEAIDGAPHVSAAAGAAVGEVMRVASLELLRPILAPTGLVGALHAGGRLPVRAGAGVAAAEPLAAALVATLVGVAAATGGLPAEPALATRPLTDLTFLKPGRGSATPADGGAADAFTGYVRVRGGEARGQTVRLATERGPVRAPRFSYYGAPADLAIRVEEGRAVGLLRYQDRALDQVPPAQVGRVLVEGEMLPDGAALLGRAGGHTGAPRGFALALLVLAAVSVVAWSWAAARTFEGRAGRAAGLVPAAALALASLGHAATIDRAGMLVVGLLAIGSLATLVGWGREIRGRAG